MSTFSPNVEENYGSNGIGMPSSSVTADQCIESGQNSYFMPPQASLSNNYQKQQLNFEGSSLNSVTTSTPNLAACLSSTQPLPPASELLSGEEGVNTLRIPPDSAWRLKGSGQYSEMNNISGSGGPLPSISSLSQKPATPLLHNQPQPSPSVPPSPYINTPSTYYSLTEPGSPATQVFNSIDYNIQAPSPSFSSTLTTNSTQIMHSVPPSPASISNLQKSPSVKNIRVTSTPDYFQEVDYQRTSYQGASTNNNMYLNKSQSVQYIVHQSKTLPQSLPTSITNNSKTTRSYRSPNYQSRGRGKSSAISSILQIRASSDSGSIDDGPTVKEHLQQQQARHKMQQEILDKKFHLDDDKKFGRRSKSSSTSVSPQKSFLQPLPYTQHSLSTHVQQSALYSPETTHGFDNSAKTARDYTVVNAQLSATPPNSSSHYSSATVNKRSANSSVTGWTSSNSGNDKAEATDDSQQQSINDALASTIASVASGASGSLEPEDLIESPLELNLSSPTAELHGSGMEYYNGSSANSNKNDTKRGSLPQGYQSGYYMQTQLSNASPLTISNSVVVPSTKTTVKGKKSQNTKHRQSLVHSSGQTKHVYLTAPVTQSTIPHDQLQDVDSNIMDRSNISYSHVPDQEFVGQQQQCTRIHVQNPPNAIGCSFPPTETTIHVVQQPRYQDYTRYPQYVGNTAKSSSLSHNQYKNAPESLPSNPAIISVHQHPSVAVIQQQDTNESDRVRHIIVQQQKFPYDQQVSGHVYSEPPSMYLSNKQQNYSSPTNKIQLSGGNMIKVRHNLSNSSTNPVYMTNQKQQSDSSTIQSPPPYHLVASTAATPPTSAYSVQQQQYYNRAQLMPQSTITVNQSEINSRQKDIEFRKYSIKLYHLQRTIKSLVYKNGALSDELARLNQRILTVTDERKMLSKRLQHYERNRIRRIQTQHRKAAAAAAAAARKVVSEMMLDKKFASTTQGSSNTIDATNDISK